VQKAGRQRLRERRIADGADACRLERLNEHAGDKLSGCRGAEANGDAIVPRSLRSERVRSVDLEEFEAPKSEPTQGKMTRRRGAETPKTRTKAFVLHDNANVAKPTGL
jgi:hypothetical protein